jgi:lipopolysaccharide transport system ATP-binding protein
MSDIVIRAQSVSKRYRIGERERYLALRDVLARAISAPARLFKARKPASPNGDASHIWALKDVSFEVRQGEAVGIIGRNGVGKTTLLKILAQVTRPTEGRARLKGRVGSLLEVGTGFHPELTGRENVYLSGAILGMRKKEIARKFDEIIAFAEVEKFVDTPVKHYSSGMQMRLAFAVAAHLEPEILIVDEVLAVGDAAFQKKCIGKMGSVASQGRTVILVSHNMGAIQQLTQRCLLLEGGRVVAIGESAPVIARYQEIAMDRSTTVFDVTDEPRRFPELSRKVQFLTLEMENCPTRLVPADADITLRITVRGNDCTESFFFGLTVFRIDGTPVGSSWGLPIHSIRKGTVGTFRLTLHEPHLAPGLYYLGLGITQGKDVVCYEDLDVVLDLLHFEMLAPPVQDSARRKWVPSWGSVRFKRLLASRLG